MNKNAINHRYNPSPSQNTTYEIVIYVSRPDHRIIRGYIYHNFLFSSETKKSALGRCYNISQVNLSSKLPKFAQIFHGVLTSRQNYGIMAKG